MLLEVRSISKSFKKQPVISDFSLEVSEGDMIALVGKRKHGKTTLMQMLAGIIPVDEGEIYYDGKLVGCKGRTAGLCKLRRKKIGFITTEAILMPDMTVYDNLLLAMTHQWGSTKKKKIRAKEVLRNLGLKGKGRFYPKELSVLDRQKVCVARAIINDPELLLCDEPTDILEGYGAEQLMDILEILNSAGYTIILSTHSKRVAMRCRKVYAVHEGLDLTGLGRVSEEDESAAAEEELSEAEAYERGIEPENTETAKADSHNGSESPKGKGHGVETEEGKNPVSGVTSEKQNEHIKVSGNAEKPSDAEIKETCADNEAKDSEQDSEDSWDDKYGFKEVQELTKEESDNKSENESGEESEKEDSTDLPEIDFTGLF